MEQEQPVIVCMPMASNATVGQDVQCKCGTTVWLSDSSLEALEPNSPAPIVMCISCFTDKYDENRDTIKPLTEKQLIEIEYHTKNNKV